MGKKNQAKAKILVIDDEGDLSELLQIGLKHDYTIETAFAGRPVLAKWQEFSPDLIVTDTYVPQDGFDLIREIRNISQVPIILVLEKELSHKVLKTVQDFVSTVIVKPFTLKDLKVKIQAALGA